MNFWNNPENNAVKIILLVLVIAGAGFFTFTYTHRDSLSNTGAVGQTGILPKVATNTTNAITKDSALLHGKLTGTAAEFAGTQTSFDYGLSTEYGMTTPSAAASEFFYAPVAKLACGKTYHFRAKATNSAGTAYGTDVTFATLSCSSTATIGVPKTSVSQATSITGTSAVLNGYVEDMAGAGGAAVSFDYGFTIAYGFNKIAGQVWARGPFSIVLADLTCGTQYYYRTKVVASGGTGYSAPIKFFTSACSNTGPTTTITTMGARPTTVGATLNAVVNPQPTWMKITTGFEYGLTTSYGSTVMSKNTTPGPFSADVVGLPRGTTYHYRAFAKNAVTGVMIYGVDATFKTI